MIKALLHLEQLLSTLTHSMTRAGWQQDTSLIWGIDPDSMNGRG